MELISKDGTFILDYQEQIAKEYGYKRLPEEIVNQSYEKYLGLLPTCFKGEALPLFSSSFKRKKEVVLENGYEILPIVQFPLYSRSNTLIASHFKRVVIGHYGAFIEIDDCDIVKENIKVAPGQEYRLTERYRNNVKYFWNTTRDDSMCKLYEQQRSVSYADYKPGKWYISPYEVLTKEEVENINYI